MTPNFIKPEQDSDTATARSTNSDREAEQRNREIAILASALIKQEEQTEKNSERTRWLRKVNSTLISGARWYWYLLPPSVRRKRQLRLLAREGLFDAEAYLRAYPDVHRSNQDPLLHYIVYGMEEDRNRSSTIGTKVDHGHKAEILSLLESGHFDISWYLRNYPDVELTGMDPAEHFLRIGKMLGRSGSEIDYGIRRAAQLGSDTQNSRALPNATILVPIATNIRQQIKKLRLFDDTWYRTQLNVSTNPVTDLLEDYLACLDVDPHRDPGPLFSTVHYMNTHPDTRGMHPLIHCVEHGLREGRSAFSADKANSFLQDSDLDRLTSVIELLDRSMPTTVLHWSDGNFFFSDIAKYTTWYLNDLGFEADCRSSLSAADASNRNLLVVAPHEFCVHGPGAAWTEEILGRAIYLNTEQWHTSWFSMAYRFATLSGKVCDINARSAAGFAKLGLRAAFLPLLPLEGNCFWHPRASLSRELLRCKSVEPLTYSQSFAERPYDLLFFGALNQRRAKALASLAPVLSNLLAFLHCPKFEGPVKADDPDMIGNSDLTQLARNSRVLLNIHQGESHYFEWHRLFLTGIMEGCVVVTEPCTAGAIALSGEHYLEVSIDEMPGKLDWLMHSEEGQATLARVHSNCHQLRKRVDAGERFSRL